MSDSFINFILMFLIHSNKKDLSKPFLLLQLEMQLSRPYGIWHFAFSKSDGLTSLYLGPLVKSFLKLLLLMIWRSLLLCVFSIYQQKINSGFVKNTSKSRLFVFIVSYTYFRVNLHSIVAWMSRNSLLETGTISEV